MVESDVATPHTFLLETKILQFIIDGLSRVFRVPRHMPFQSQFLIPISIFTSSTHIHACNNPANQSIQQ